MWACWEEHHWRVFLLNVCQKEKRRKEHPAKGCKAHKEAVTLSNKKPKEPAGPSLLVMAARTPGKSEQLEGMVRSGSPHRCWGATHIQRNSSCPWQEAARLKGSLARRLNMRPVMRRDRHDNCLVGNTCLQPAPLIVFPLNLLRTKARGLETPSNLHLGGR